MEPEVTAGNGHQDIKFLTVTLRSGKPWKMPDYVARAILESLARDEPVKFGRHLQAALMGDMPAAPGRRGEQ